jgi:hypothetical protein
MRSSTGQHFVGLDHVRALAAFMVVVWHFSHRFTGVPVPFNQAPLLGFLDEGHVGVALFMVPAAICSPSSSTDGRSDSARSCGTARSACCPC